MLMFELCFVYVLVALQPGHVLAQRWWENSAPTKPKVTQQTSTAVPKTFTFDIGQGYEIFFDGRFISFKPISKGSPAANLGAPANKGQSPLGKVLGGQGGTLLLTLNNKTNTIGGRVAGWAAGPTTEPALGPNDRMNTTDVPEEIEARPDKTRAQRRALLRRMNPGFTNAQIEAQLIRDDKARAKMAATQSEPVVLLPEPPSLPVPPTPIKPKPKGNNKATNKKQKPKRVLKARRKKQKVARRRKPRPTTTTPEPTYPPTYPTTTDLYPPTTYPTSASYQFATNPSNQRFRQQNQFQPRRQQQQQFQQQQYPPPQQQFPQQQQQQQYNTPQQSFQRQQPNRRRNMANRPQRRQQRRRQQRRNRPPPRKIVGSEVDHILSLFG